MLVCRSDLKGTKLLFGGALVEHEARLPPPGAAVWGGLHSGSSGLPLVGESSDRCGELACDHWHFNLSLVIVWCRNAAD